MKNRLRRQNCDLQNFTAIEYNSIIQKFLCYLFKNSRVFLEYVSLSTNKGKITKKNPCL